MAKARAVAIVPLGERHDPSHKHEYKNLSQFKKILNKEWSAVTTSPSNTVLAVYKKPMKKARALTPFGDFKPPKPAMSGMTEAFDVSQIWEWAKDRTVVAEPKLNGFRMIIAKQGNNYKIYTDSKKDRAKYYPSLKEEIEKVPDDFMADCSMGIEKNGKPLPRIKLMTLMADKPELREGERIVCTVFDLPFWKEDLHAKPFKERRKELESFYKKHLKASENFEITEYKTIGNKEELDKTFKRFAKYPQSEGVVVKDVESKWDPDGSIEGWAKLKVEAEIKVMVIERHSVKGGRYNYTCGVLKGDSKFENITRVGDMELVDLGKTYNTEITASPGAILTIGVEEIIPSENKLDWLGARVLDKDESRKEPYFANQVIKIAENAHVLQKESARKATDEEGAAGVEGNMDFEIGDSGDAVAQLHIMGIEEKELEDLISIKDRARVARADLRKLESLVKGKIGEQGAHIDVRFHRKKDKYWEGGEIMIGNLSGLSKIYNYKEGQSLRFGWKVPRKGEAKINVIRGPMDWFKAGVDKIEIFKPGEVGATANTYAAMLRIDKFDWTLYMADKHAKKFHVSGSRHFDGNWLVAYVPVTEEGEKGKRVWMMRRLAKDDHEKKEKADTPRVNSPTLAYKAVYGAAPSKPLRGMTDAPKKEWHGLQVDEHIKDKWLEELNSIPDIEIRASDEGKSKDRVAFVVFRMKDKAMDSEAQNISKKLSAVEGLYSLSDTGSEGRPRVVVAGKVVYGQKGWENWWSGLASKIKKAIESVKKNELYLGFLKVDKKEFIVGGVVYSANEEDTQGEGARGPEIWKALKKFMIKGGNIKIMHKGRAIKARVVECYQAEEDHHKGGAGDKHLVKAGDWWLSIYLGDEKEIWEDVVKGKLNGFSMGGTAKAAEPIV